MESITLQNKNLENIDLNTLLERNDLAKQIEDLLYNITHST